MPNTKLQRPFEESLLHFHSIYQDSKLLAPVVYFAESVKSVWEDQNAQYTWIWPRPARKETNLRLKKESQERTVLIYTLYFAVAVTVQALIGVHTPEACWLRGRNSGLLIKNMTNIWISMNQNIWKPCLFNNHFLKRKVWILLSIGT